MQISLSMLSQTGGHGDGWMASGEVVNFLPSHPGVPRTVVDGADEMRRTVRELVRMGADVIKVAVSGGVLSPRDKPTHAHFCLAELEMLVEEAAAAGIWVMAHAQAAPGIKNAIHAGIRSIDHGIYLDDEAIQLMLDRAPGWCRRSSHRGALSTPRRLVPPSRLSRLRRRARWSRRIGPRSRRPSRPV